MTQTDQPSNTITIKGIKWLAGFSVVSGLALGGLGVAISGLSRWVYCQNLPSHSLTLQFSEKSSVITSQDQELKGLTNRSCGGPELIVALPWLLAVTQAGIVGWTIRKRNVTSPLVSLGFSTLSGLVVSGTYHGIEYLNFRQEVSRSITEEIGQHQSINANQIVDQILKRETGMTGFWGYLKFEAQEGIMVVSAARKNSPVQIKGSVAWRWWLLDLALIQVGGGLTAYEVSRSPFCKTCKKWYKKKQFVGFVEPDFAEEFLYLLDHYHFNKAGQLVYQVLKPSGYSLLLMPEGCLQVFNQGAVQILRPQPDLDDFRGRRLGVYLQHCSYCNSCDSILTISQITLTAKGAIPGKHIFKQVLSPTQEDEFMQRIADDPNTPDRVIG